MRLVSSIFNFSRTRPALVATIVAIIAIEALFGLALGSPEDRVLYYSDPSTEAVINSATQRIYNADYVFLGDSVAREAFFETNYPEITVASMATNQAVGFTGQYFLMKRYLRRNPAPKRVILFTTGSFDQDLREQWTENYVQRNFTRVDEIADILTRNFDPSFALATLAYGLLPTYRYRRFIAMHFLERLWLVPLSRPTSPPTFAAQSLGHADHSLATRLRLELRRRFEPRPLGERYFERLIALVQNSGAILHFVSSPLSRSRHESIAKEQRDPAELTSPRTASVLASANKSYPALRVVDDLLGPFDDGLFRDAVHLNEQGKRLFNPRVERLVRKIVADQEKRTAP